MAKSRAKIFDADGHQVRIKEPDVTQLADVLEPFRGVKKLTIQMPVGRDHSAIRCMAELEELVFRPWKAPTFEPIGELKTLEVVRLTVYGNASDLSPFADLPRLRTLEISCANGVHDLSPLARCSNLTHLEFDHVLPESRPWYQSAEPLLSLKNLRVLAIDGPIKDHDLRFFAKMQQLEELRLNDKFDPIEEIAWLAKHMPNVKRGCFQAYSTVSMPCDKCGTALVRLSGKVRICLACPKCRKKLVDDHKAKFDAVLNA